MTAEVPAPPDKSSHGEVVRSAAIIGGATLIGVLFSIVRYKALAVILGPGGIGLFGLYSTIADLTRAVAGLGIQASGVRQVAEAAGTANADRIARTAAVLERASLLLGFVAAIILAALARPVSIATFGEPGHAFAISFLGLAVMLGIVSGGQVALVQGLRRVGDLARINILGALASTLVTVPIIYVFQSEGIVLSLIAMSAATLLASWWYSRRIVLSPVSLTVRDIARETRSLFGLGLVFMASGVLTIGAVYMIRLIVLRYEGLVAAGLYQAAWTLGGLYAGFILQAMGTDFYPRLTAVADDHPKCNRLVNDQIQVSILIAGPGLIATLTGADMLIAVLYSGEFHAAAGLVRWICVGMMLRVLTWPIGFIVVAKGARQAFFWTEVAATIVHVGLAWLLVRMTGLTGSGLAFVGLYLWHAVVINLIARRMTGFRWSRDNLWLVIGYVPTAGVVFGAFHVLSFWQAICVGTVIAGATGVYSLWALTRLLSDTLPAPLRIWLRRITLSSV